MRHVSYRDRTPDDDTRSVLHVKAKVEIDAKGDIELPAVSPDPIVVWSANNNKLNARDTHSYDEGNIDAHIQKCMQWPLRTDLLCHNCCHSFDTTPVPLPYSYDGVRNIYLCRGVYCSWQCAKAYNLSNTPHAGRGNVNMNISLLAHRMWVKYIREDPGKRDDPGVYTNLRQYTTCRIEAAKNRDVLRIFGGEMTIEQYRKGFFGIVPPQEAVSGKPFITIRHRMYLPFANMGCQEGVRDDKGRDSTDTKSVPWITMNTMGTSVAHNHANEFCEKLNRATKEKTTIKRKREDSTKNTLISSMGVKVAQRGQKKR